MPKRLLMLANEFPPIGGAGVQRNFYFCKYLPAEGWSPIVVTVRDVVFPVHDLTLIPQLPPEVSIVRTESLELRRVLWWWRRLRRPSAHQTHGPTQEVAIGSSLREAGRGLRSWLFVPDDRMLWAPFALAAARRAMHKHPTDVILAGAPPYSVGVIGYLASVLSGVPLVVDLRDPWTLDPYSQGPTRLHRWVNRRMESRALHRARRILVISDAMREALLRTYPSFPPEKVVVITNGYDGLELSQVEPLERNGEFAVAYVGSLYAHHRESLRSFCAAWDRLAQEDPQFASSAIFWAVGRCDPEIEAELASWPRMRVRRFGYQSHSDAMRCLVGASTLLLLIKNLRPADGVITIPGKLFEYVAAGPPILMVGPRGDAAGIVESVGGTVDPEGDLEAIVAHLRLQFEASKETKSSARPAPSQQYDRRFLTQRLAAVLETVLPGTAAGAKK